MKITKRVATVLAFVLFFAVLLSVIFIAHETDHNCIGDGCSVCARIAVCETVLRNICTAVFAATAVTAVRFTYVSMKAAADKLFKVTTPVSLKVKLSD